MFFSLGSKVTFSERPSLTPPLATLSKEVSSSGTLHYITMFLCCLPFTIDAETIPFLFTCLLAPCLSPECKVPYRRVSGSCWFPSPQNRALTQSKLSTSTRFIVKGLLITDYGKVRESIASDGEGPISCWRELWGTGSPHILRSKGISLCVTFCACVLLVS